MKTQMRRVFAAYYFAAAMFGFFGIPCLSFSQEASPDYIVSIRDWRHVVVRKNDHIYMDFSAEQHMKPDEWLDNDAGPLNPDGRYIPVLAASLFPKKQVPITSFPLGIGGMLS